jgi:hypothetical protein
MSEQMSLIQPPMQSLALEQLPHTSSEDNFFPEASDVKFSSVHVRCALTALITNVCIPYVRFAPLAGPWYP